MVWNEPGGRDPWGRKDKDKGGDGPPDLDELLRRANRQLSRLFGGRRGSGGGSGGEGGEGPRLGGAGLTLIGIIGLLVWLASGFYIVNPAERGVVTRFGKLHHVTTEGPRWHLPAPIEAVTKVNVDNISSSTYSGLMLTRDENIVNVDVAAQYRVGDAVDYLFTVRAPDATLRDALISAVREVIGKSEMDFVLREGRSEVAARTRQLLQRVLDDYGTGLVVTSVNLQDAQPPEPVQAAFDDATKAREDKQRIINEADAYANSVLPQARGAAARILEEGQAYQAQRVAAAEGESDRFLALLTEYQQAPGITRERLYLETMESVLANNPKVLAGAGGDSLMYLPMDQLLRAGGGNAAQVLEEMLARQGGSGSAGAGGAATGTNASGGRGEPQSSRTRERRP